jgi:spore germination protein
MGENMEISKNLQENIDYIENAFKDSQDTVKRKISLGESLQLQAYVVYIDLITDVESIDEFLLKGFLLDPSIISNISEEGPDLREIIKNSGIQKIDVTEVETIEKALDGILAGDTVMFFDGCDVAFEASTRKYPTRGVSKTESETVVQGSKESFTEVFRFNTALIRKRIRDTRLKVKQFKIGRRTKTNAAAMYMEDIVRPEVLEEVTKRIEQIDIDGIFDVGYIDQLLEKNYLSPFPQGQITERPDKASSAILEGRVAIVVDNSPYALLYPTTLNAFFQSSEDYYQRWEIMSFIRILRYIGGILSVVLPGLYIALALYHPSMLPMELVFKMAEARKSVPFPSLLEMLLMEALYELLREAGIRLPSAVGNTLGIVGGLIIGQAAVEAGLASPIVVIIVAMTGISGFSIPSYSLVTGFRLSKYLVLVLSSALGVLGFWIGIILILTHLASLESFGIPYMFPYVSGDLNNFEDYKDTFFRLPIFTMKKRPIFANPNAGPRFKDSEENV